MKRQAVKLTVGALAGAVLVLACLHFFTRSQHPVEGEASPAEGEKAPEWPPRPLKSHYSNGLYTFHDDNSFRVLPGMSVDIICVPRDRDAGQTSNVARIVLQNVRVTAFDWVSCGVTFPATPQQAAELSEVEEWGDLRTFFRGRGPE
jgi:hypothetical protein